MRRRPLELSLGHSRSLGTDRAAPARRSLRFTEVAAATMGNRADLDACARSSRDTGREGGRQSNGTTLRTRPVLDVWREQLRSELQSKGDTYPPVSILRLIPAPFHRWASHVYSSVDTRTVTGAAVQCVRSSPNSRLYSPPGNPSSSRFLRSY